MKFNELLSEGRNFHIKELDKIKSYVTDNNGHFHQVEGQPKVKLSFNEGEFKKITISKGDVMYSLTTGDKTRRFKDFNSLVDFLEKET